ncbi:MAG: hypothetical protein R3Y24_00945 [Eubacteriales bacterium]
MFDNKNRFVIENFNKNSTFSSFLPGISGEYGIPMWCFYVNRGQAVTSFGIENKNHSIMEFYPAHQAYQITKNMGFRTFLKIDGKFYEPFRSDEANTKMYIGMNELEIEECNEELGFQINVRYFTLPNENLGGLTRIITIKNTTNESHRFEVMDGMPAIIPYGMELDNLKEMAQTMKAWMQVEDVETKVPYYRVRFSTKDSAQVSKIDGGNFMISVSDDGTKLPIIGDAELVFDYDTAFEKPVRFIDTDVNDLCLEKQIVQNQVPSGFACVAKTISSDETAQIYTVIGQGANKELVKNFADKQLGKDFFEKKYEEALCLTTELGEMIETKSNNPVFDAYCKQTYLDNVLRGGFPTPVGKDKIFYLYSRKHGDIERDYNFFSMLPEYFSQGNGNFRDVNQNRRSDVLFTPFVKDYNIKVFYNLIQLDGYNPLSVKQVSYVAENKEVILEQVIGDRSGLEKFLEREFSPGKLFYYLSENKITLKCGQEEFLELVMNHSKEQLNADFSEGYWTDHWTYNLDLVETFISIYPELEKKLLFEDESYTYFESKAVVNPRIKRYVKTEQGMRQYHAVNEELKENVAHTEARTKYGKGEVYYTNLMTKLLVLAANKFTAVDMQGMGIEMEGGKPGWYDALNGLPGIFGSSMSETYEVQRMLRFIIKAFEKYQVETKVSKELYQFLETIGNTMESYNQDNLYVWNHLNMAKEMYREETTWGVDGEEIIVKPEKILPILTQCSDYLADGIKKACKMKNGIAPTYFSYSFSDFDVVGSQIVPKDLQIVELPLFLEGPVRYYKLLETQEEKKALYTAVKESDLYDDKLHMYKVNASLEDAPYEVGRAKAFSPGWLENESIWLHMEYKYLLELLKSDLYEEFFEAFEKAAVPFLDEKVYGRSSLENSSFIVSSANSNKKLHGKGFVARLSGSTAEFLQIWHMMMFGKQMFSMENNELVVSFNPAIPKNLLTSENQITCTLFGNTEVTYHVKNRTNVIPNEIVIDKILMQMNDGEKIMVESAKLKGKIAEELREGSIKTVEVWME